MNIYITAIIKAKPTYQSEVLTLLQKMVRETRKESACIRYDLHQDTSDENIFIFYEIWENRQGLDNHNKQPYIMEFGSIVAEKIQGRPQIYLTQKI